ncbi:MAG: hypothetical protein V3571_02480 [Pseudodesulfovibrio sp.]
MTDTEFRVLPVRKGDAYLLKSARGCYLVDGGGFGCDLPDLLQERGARRLRAAICTQVSPSAMGGLLETMRAGLPVAEYWLPEGLTVLPELALRFNGDLSGWLALAAGGAAEPPPSGTSWPLFALERGRRMLGAAGALALAMAAGQGTWRGVLPDASALGPGRFFLHLITRLMVDSPPPSDGAPLLTEMIGPLLTGMRVADLCLLCGRMILERFGRSSDGQRVGPAVVRALALGAMTAALADLTGARLRHFRPVDRLADHLVPRHPLMCLNGVESRPLPGLGHTVRPETILRQAAELAAPGRGLVFRYGEADCGVLFLSNSHLRFLPPGETLRLDRPTVVTAPGRGSCRQEQVYERVLSDSPEVDFWVRGRLPRARKVSPAFRRKVNVRCLHNCRLNTLREILLLFRGGGWTSEDAPCSA